MKFWNNLRVGTKYGAAFGVTMLLFLIAGAVVYYVLNIAQESVDNLDERGTIAIEVAEMSSLARTKDIRIADYLRKPSTSYINEYEERMERMSELLQTYSERFQGSELEQSMTVLTESDQQINSLFLEQMVGNVSSTNEIDRLRQQTQILRQQQIDLLAEIQTRVEQAMDESAAEAKSNLLLTIIVLFIATVVAITIGVLLIWLINRQVVKRLNRLVSTTEQIADGELFHETIEEKSRDEIGQLHVSMHKMKGNLRTLIQDIDELSNRVSTQSSSLQQSSHEVQEAQEQVAATMEELSSGSEQQAGDATTLSQMMDELVSKMQTSNQTSTEVVQKSQEVLKKSDHGKQLMDGSIDRMNDIHLMMETAVEKVHKLDRQSGEISKLIQVIQDIAEQTNLLALNAAIEAARAGEHGRGFAVVADEVRKLAEQVSDSVDGITTVVESIQSDSKDVTQSLEEGYQTVEHGTSQIHETGQTFEDIQFSLQQMVEGMDAISANLEDISDRTLTMNQSIESVASSSEEAAAGVEQTTASIQQTSSSMEQVSMNATDLSQLSLRLDERIKQFQLKE
ncbi:HAMP domain-containing protein [Halobacillus fulvus]|nr:HAMP domain-containing protein [Halobacillus fulvus]